MAEQLREALEYAVELREGQEVVYEQEGKVFYDTTKARLAELDPIKRAETLTVNSLSGLVGYLKSNFCQMESVSKLLLHVESPTKVVVYSSLDKDRKRESVIEATALLDVFPYGRFMNSEDFIINVQSIIQRDLDAEAILACASSIRIEGGGDLIDNGISQTVTVKEGAATLTKAEVPSPAELRPYRTFLEVEQPSSLFVFRINKIGACALFEADGGIWKHTAMENIHEFLNSELDELIKEEVVTIIA
ncbi:hypothetical protein [Enterococcus gallinarum]|uniref:hypothetical protein n=1 Tax=Enterococcus gallinarum TaxID=1353 RepID=UPI001AD7CBC9|nr:hypothetical protein [Enterococcus gallinarum]MBO6419920.1 hypothetical protein [Enterococcus gallinarum]MBO6423560.1 hypothetical protein [Enterococcus gallinarum]